MSKDLIDFGLKNAGGILKIDARQGGLKMRDGNGDDVTFKWARMKMDLANLKVGWAQFRQGEGVVMRGTASDESPGEDWQLGVKVMVDGRDEITELGRPIGDAEICSTSYVVRGAFADLYNKKYAPLADDHPGETPVVEFYDWRAIKMPNGTAYQPAMRIVGWAGKKDEAAENDDLNNLLQ